MRPFKLNKMTSTSGPVSWAELSAAIAANPLRSKGCGFSTGSAGHTILATPDTGVGVSWLSAPGWTEETTFVAADVLSFVLWLQNPMYRAAADAVRRTMEQEVASALLKDVSALWRSHGGRGRGWVRKHLEEDLRARAAGTEPVGDFWAELRTNRRTAHMADFLCVVRKATIAIWWPVGRAVSLIPLSGAEVVTTGVAQINAETRRPLLGPTGASHLKPATELAMLVAGAKGVSWIPPACAPSAGTHTVAQIQERIETIVGVGGPKRTGGRAVLWGMLHWELLQKELAGVTDGVTMGMLTDESTGSGTST
jgi:hypothetical protein